MKKILIYIGVLAIIAVIGAGLLVYRKNRIDKGLMALKDEDYVNALHYFKPLAFIGDTDAQHALGEMYAFGWGVKKDDSEAIKWFHRAGNDVSRSAYYVAERYRTLYENKYGNPSENAADALKWYRISAQGGSFNAAEFLGKAYAEGLLELTIDLKQSQHWYSIAKEKRQE